MTATHRSRVMLDTTERFTLEDLAFAQRTAAQFRAAMPDSESALHWTAIAGKIEKVLAREYVVFTRTDATVIASSHIAVLHAPLDEAAKLHNCSRELGRLGRLVTLAERGRLAQLENAGGAR